MRRLLYLCKPHTIHNIYMQFCRVRIIIISRASFYTAGANAQKHMDDDGFSFHRGTYRNIYYYYCDIKQNIYYNISFP